jgi:phage gp46-like protein
MTAVEFLISIKQRREIDSFDFDQALRMEKQQIKQQNESLTKREHIAAAIYAQLATDRNFNGDKAYNAVLMADKLLNELG